MTNKVKTGLFFGSFNPVHIGHLALANYIAENSELDEVWFIVSPQNPFKKSSDLIDTKHRINMLELCIKKYPKFKVNGIELELPTPSYTYITLQSLRQKYPTHNFSVIMGSDNFALLSKWKNSSDIIKQHPIIVYPRPEYPIVIDKKIKDLNIIEAPVFNIDSTSIRKGIKTHKDYRFLVPEKAYEYILTHKLYL